MEKIHYAFGALIHYTLVLPTAWLFGESIDKKAFVENAPDTEVFGEKTRKYLPGICMGVPIVSFVVLFFAMVYFCR